jgi:hypothetical protein
MAHNRPKILIKPNARYGSNATEMDSLPDVCFPPDSDRTADIAGGPFRARKRLLDCSTQHLYSITSSARASNVGGTTRPIALAALRLTTSSNLVGCCTGRSAGFSPFMMRAM